MKGKMSQDEFEYNFKKFKRFLKEIGRYHFMMSYLFPEGRKKEDLLNDINNCRYFWENNLSFGDILHITNTIGKNYPILGHVFWEDNICDISKKLEEYFKTNGAARLT